MNIMRMVKQLFSGDMIYSPPETPVRGYDAVARDRVTFLRYFESSMTGAGMQCGMYGRTQPYLANAAVTVVLQEVSGAGIQANSAGMGGHLVMASSLAAPGAPLGI
jgi:hypothetical protein